jgi:3',5'-cyclic AMP phosphodiesterase CpdA
MMTTLLHISDTHFGTCTPEVVEALRRLVEQQRPSALVLSGDITQRARPAEFSAGRSFVDSLGVPLFLSVPGNHDIPLFALATRLFAPYQGYIKHFGPHTESFVDSPTLLIVGVNTTRRWRHSNGEVSQKQVDRVCALLSQAKPDQLRVVVTHQPALVTRPQDHAHRLRGGVSAAQAWADCGADLILGGHAHLPYTASIASRAQGMLHCLQAGTALSSRTRHGEPNSVNIARWSAPTSSAARAVQAERWDYKNPMDGFALASVQSLALGPR